VEIMFPAADCALFGVAVLSGRTWVLAVTVLATGAWLWSPAPSASVILFALGSLLLLVAGDRRHRRRARPAAAGAKSRLLRGALARRMRDLAVPALA
jgi:membrane protein implicated in regulation of membrane protease activity